ncbi:ATP-binding cassette, subfamily B [Nakamurella panacisegetis]|uniref:ATP-binding cassette, subfamily B n=1 Tax=Nakamurella panacisegetis TaxID=1090615 RepID=A0A1H0J2T6_9ACTN|nr:ABC transporter ATP-binding protein [Nakamurella panacisegetis]SDO38025.1 ATP-binding cassette, subfamily B [Nakamurella panacisegetis]
MTNSKPTAPTAPANPRTTTTASLKRLLPFARPALPALGASAVAAIVATVCGLTFPLVIQWIIDGPIARRQLGGLWWPAVLLVILGVAEATLFWARRMLATRPTMRVEASMRAALYERLQQLPVSFHDRWPAGQLLSRAVSDLSTIRRFLAFGLVFLVVNLATFVIGVGILITLSWPLGLIVAALAIPLVLLSFQYESRYQILARRSQDQVGDLATVVEESVLGVRILKAFGRSSHLRRSFLRQAGDLRDTELSKSKVISVLWAVIIALPEIALGIALVLGVRQVAAGTLSAGTLVAFFGTAMGLRWPIDSIGWLLAIANDTAAASDRYFEVMDAPVTVTSPDHPIPAPNPSGRLRLKDVRFHFADAAAVDGHPADTLRGIDLDLHPGETVALVGATGSGKTTLSALINRLYDVTGGSIELDGVDIRDLDLDVLRSRVSVAFEEPTLFSASVRENVLMGKPDGSDDEVRAALAVSRADFVDELPWGLDTRIGEQGMSLSGGQRQRLALARAVVAHPSVLVMDDPLSALDIHTEAEVEAGLRSVLAGTTTLVIAHRASTVMLADRVALLQHGRIAAVGTHSELMSTVPAYRDLLASRDDAARAAEVNA